MFWVPFFIASTVSGFSLAPRWCERRPLSPSMIGYSYRLTTTSIGVIVLAASDGVEQPPNYEHTARARLRTLTGFSLTALRATMRAATGISLTALYASTLAASGVWIRQTMKVILSIVPAWARYFVQPFLIIYYAPLFILRSISAPQRNQGVKKHDALVESWKQAVETADQSTSYWPLHLDKNGDFEADIAEMDLTDAVAQSVELAMEEHRKQAES
jgi:hypothetical protein